MTNEEIDKVVAHIKNGNVRAVNAWMGDIMAALLELKELRNETAHDKEHKDSQGAG